MSAPLFRWVVEAPLGLDELLHRHGLSRALGGGRVFVDARREHERRVLATGSVVEVYAPRPAATIDVLSEHEGVWAVEKPAALPTEPDKAGSECVLLQLAERVGVEQSRLVPISRLDVGVSGVLLVTADAASRQALLEQRARGTLRRRYVALACGVPTPESGQWREALGRGARGQRVVDGRFSQAAHSQYRVVATAQPVARDRPLTSLLALSPITGRTHQLRVHASAHGAPLLGDRRYRGPSRMTDADGSVRSFTQVQLHAALVEWGPEGRRQRVVSEPSSGLLDAWLALGGEATAFQRALDD